jgi:hypothetical protein
MLYTYAPQLRDNKFTSLHYLDGKLMAAEHIFDCASPITVTVLELQMVTSLSKKFRNTIFYW